MKPEQQRIKLAEWSGNPCPKYFGEGYCAGNWVENLPDYLSNPNAVHELENKLTEHQMLTMNQYLHRQFGMLWGFCTASQRCEALLKTLGLWEVV